MTNSKQDSFSDSDLTTFMATIRFELILAKLDGAIAELEKLKNHLMGDLYDKNDTNFEDNKELIGKLDKRLAELKAQRQTLLSGEE